MRKFSKVTLRTDRHMPLIGLGTWELTRDTADKVEKALELGYRMIDTSADYGTQPGIGEAMHRSGLERDEIYLVTKVEEDENGYEATQKNLEELDQDYSDLVLIHRPPSGSAGAEIWEQLIKARSDGIARDIGVSNYSIDEMEALVEATGETPAVNQIEWTPFGHDQEMLEYCREHDIIIQAYSPLTRTERLDDENLLEIAESYDRTAAQLLIRWNLQLGVVPIPKAAEVEHMEENLDVFNFEISESDMRSLNELNERYSSLTSLQYL